MRLLLLALAVAFVLPGCVSRVPEPAVPASMPAPDLSGLGPDGAGEILDAGNGSRTFVFTGVAEKGLGLSAVPHEGLAGIQLRTRLPVDARVGYVELVLMYEAGLNDLEASLFDEKGRPICVAEREPAPKRCTTPVPPDAPPAAWALVVLAHALEPTPWRLEVTLHPGPLLLPSPRSGTDPSIVFRTVLVEKDRSFEPSVGVLADGTLFAQMDLGTWRSRDDGRTWENVAPPTTDKESFDPVLHVDPWTGTVYVDQLTIACTLLAFSQDSGESWITNPAACGLPGVDHPKLASGPSPIPGSPFPAVYLAFSGIVRILGGTEPVQTFWVSRSLDGGLTWTPTLVDTGHEAPSPFAQGPIRADREGNVYVASGYCDTPDAQEGPVGVAVSNDHASSFRIAFPPGARTLCTAPDPGLAVDAAGNAYVAWVGTDGVAYSMSTDRGATWSEPRRVSPDALGSFSHVVAAAGDEGRLAVGYLATPDSRLPFDRVDGFAGWHLYVSFVDDALGPAPRAATALATDPAAPVHRGPICLTCLDGRRNLGDFNDMAVLPDGRVVVGYDHGCDGACPTPADSLLSLGYVAVLETGPRLHAGVAPWAAGGAGLPGPQATSIT